MKKLETYDAEVLKGKNTFVCNMRISCTKNTSTSEFVVAEDVEELLIGKTYPTERTQRVCIYYTPGVRDKVAKLSLQAKSLLFYILYHLEPKQDFIQINRQYYMSANKVKSPNTYKTALKELIAEQIIAPTGIYDSVYWINPYYIFPGNRLTAYHEKIQYDYER